MDDLRRYFEELGFTNVTTFIASGNVIFDGPGKTPREDHIEGHLRSHLGFDAPVFLRTPEELTEIVSQKPFSIDDTENPEFRIHVCFLRSAPPPDHQETLRSLETKMDAFQVRGREVYWLCRGPLNQSLAKWTQIEKRATGPATARNVTMLRRLTESLSSEEGPSKQNARTFRPGRSKPLKRSLD